MNSNKSLILFLEFLSNLLSIIFQVLIFYLFWLIIKIWTVSLNFDFTSATLGFLLGYVLILYNMLVKSLRLKRISSFSTALLTVIILMLTSSSLYKFIVDFASDTDKIMNHLLIVSVVIAVLYVIQKLFEFLIKRLVQSLFESNENEFELIRASTHYSKSGVELNESYFYVLKGFNPFSISYTEIIETKKD